MSKLKGLTWDRAVLVVTLVAVFLAPSGPLALGLVLAASIVREWLAGQQSSKLLTDTARLAAIETEVRALTSATAFTNARR